MKTARETVERIKEALAGVPDGAPTEVVGLAAAAAMVKMGWCMDEVRFRMDDRGTEHEGRKLRNLGFDKPVPEHFARMADNVIRRCERVFEEEADRGRSLAAEAVKAGNEERERIVADGRRRAQELRAEVEALTKERQRVLDEAARLDQTKAEIGRARAELELLSRATSDQRVALDALRAEAAVVGDLQRAREDLANARNELRAYREALENEKRLAALKAQIMEIEARRKETPTC